MCSSEVVPAFETTKLRFVNRLEFWGVRSGVPEGLVVASDEFGRGYPVTGEGSLEEKRIFRVKWRVSVNSSGIYCPCPRVAL